MSSPDKKPTSRQAARRKLLGGAFSAPAVLTLYSGNALAAGSSLRCLAYAANQGTIKSVGGMDAYLRVPLYPMSTNAARFWIKGADVFSKWLPAQQSTKATWGITSGGYQEFSISDNKLVGSPQTSDPSLGAADPSRFACLRFDASGNIKGVGKSGSGGAMPGTCWASAVPFI